jgi:acid phosphatase family membrane protein YuiD
MYQILLLPALAGLLAQTIKMFLRSNKLKPSLMNLSAYSGMPSGHSATVAALATIVGLEEGIASPDFGIAMIMAALIIRDAIGIRRYLGEHGRILNVLVKDLDEDKLLDKTYPKLLEKIGHTPAQVLAGITLGVSVSLIGYLIIN